MTRIFVSYRRDDSAGHTGRISDYLSGHFGQDEIFRDVEHIAPGLDFVQSIERAVASCDILIAVIGRQWLTISDANGNRRLDNPDDFIRLEVATALQRNIRVIPLLVQRATMPSAEDLPEPLKGLARRNALELHDTNWSSDMDRLLSVLDTALAGIKSGVTVPLDEPASARAVEPNGQPRGASSAAIVRAASTRSSILIAIPIILLLTLAGGWLAWTRRAPPEVQGTADTARAPQQLPAATGSSIDSTDLTGTYRVTGKTSNGTAYGGTMKLSKTGTAYLLSWQLPDEYTGVGLQQGDVLSVAFGSGKAQCSVLSYQIQADGSLDGLWLTTGADKPGSERIVPTGDVDTASLAGAYTILGANASGTTYGGTLTIIPRGPVYELGWKIGSTTHQGVGIRHGDIVSVAWGVQPCAIHSFQIGTDGALRGQYSGYGTFLIGTEDAVRQ